MDQVKDLVEYVANELATQKPHQLGSEELNALALFDREVHRAPLPSPAPLPKALRLLTLRSLVEYVAVNLDELDFGGYLIHVEGPCRVQLVSALEDFHRRRATVVEVVYEPTADKYLDKYLPLETAIVGLMAEFQPDEMRDRLIASLKAVKREDTEVREDSGVSQSVSVKSGVHMVRMETIPNPVVLCPNRTFPEVEQPSSSFIVRLKVLGDEPQVLLQQADGAGWKVVAAERVGLFLKAALASVVGNEAPSVIY
jgi:hypothetical protein